jgi:hypothetical protein
MQFVPLILACLLLPQGVFPQRRRARRSPPPAPPVAETAPLPGSAGAPQTVQPIRPLSKDVLIRVLEKGRGKSDQMSWAEFVDGIQKRRIKFRFTPAEERDIRKAGDYLIAGDLEKLITALRDKKNYRPETTLSGRIDEVRVTDSPNGDIYLFIRLTVSNSGVQSTATNYTLRMTRAGAGSFTLNGGVPAEIEAPFTVMGDGKSEVVIKPEDSLVQKSRQAIKEGQPVTGWLRFEIKKSPKSQALTAKILRRCGVWYIISFTDINGELYEATYEME